MRDKSKILTVLNTGKKKIEEEQSSVQQIIRGGSGSGSSVGAYLLKSIWDRCWEIRKTDKGEEYLFGKLPVGLQFDLTSFVDAGLIDLPTLYDGLVIDNQTIYWEKVTEEIPDEDGNIVTKVTKVLKAKGGGGTADKVTWTNIEDKPSWIGELKPEYTWDEIKDKPIWIDGSKLVYKWTSNTGAVNQETVATETWVENKYLPLTGGTIEGNLRLQKITSDNTYGYGCVLYFGDGSHSYITEESDDVLKIYSRVSVEISTKADSTVSGLINLSCNGIKVNGGLLKYNSNDGYWELEGDLLVNGGITSYE